MVSVDDLIDKKQKEEIIKINKKIEKIEKRFQFIRNFIKENFHEIAYSVKNNPNISQTELPELCYERAEEVYTLIKESHFVETRLELTRNSSLKSIKDYLPVKLGIFEINWDDEKGNLVLTEKGKTIKKEYFD